MTTQAVHGCHQTPFGSDKSKAARRASRPKSMSLLPEWASNTGQQCEAQAWDIWANLAGNVPTQVRELDLLGLVESRKQAFHSAQRTERGACSGRPSSSLFEVRGSLHRLQACLVLNLSTLLVSDSFSPSPSAPAQRSWQAPGGSKVPNAG